MTRINISSPRIDTYFGTLLYGTMVQIAETLQVFVIEDIYHYEGINLKKWYSVKNSHIYTNFLRKIC